MQLGIYKYDQNAIDIIVCIDIRYLLFYSIMMKHQDWVSNRGYQQHLNVLTKIFNRHSSKAPHTNSLSPRHEDEQKIVTQTPKEMATTVRSKDNLNMKEQKILWDNYHLGKRIIQTQPVISKRKFDQDYKKHKRLVECLTASTSRRAMPTDFRVKKLQEYKENLEQMGEGRAIKTAAQNHFLRFKIQSLTFYRQKPILDELLLVLTRYTKEGKPRKQKTQSFPAEDLLNRHFFFSIPKRLLNKQEALTIQIQQLKGLTKLSLGYFSFPSKQTLEQTAQIFHCGKPIGEVIIRCGQGRKSLSMLVV